MKILVAGGCGYVGSVLVPELQSNGHDVTVVDLCWFGNHLPPDIPVIVRDVMSLKKEDLVGQDQVIFLAGLSNDPMADFNPAQNFTYNGAAPAYLCYLAKQAGVSRFIYASSCSVYGNAGVEFCGETYPTSPKFPYGISKLMGERAVLEMADSRFHVIVLRKGTVNGWSPRMRLDLVINQMVSTALRDGVIHIGSPNSYRAYLGMEDAVRAYRGAVEADAGNLHPAIVNIFSGNETIGEIGRRVAASLLIRGISLKSIQVSDVPDPRSYRVTNTEPGATLIYHTPICSIESIVNELLDGDHSVLVSTSPIYRNIDVFKKIGALQFGDQ